MTKAEMEKELGDLIFRFKVLKKALAEGDTSLSPAHQRAAEIAASLKRFTDPPPPPKLSREAVLQKAREVAEQQHSQRLANQLQKAGILGMRPPPRQPTNDEMKIAAQNMWAQQNGFQTQEALDKAEAEWGNGINNWLIEAQKPINQKFKSEEEERAYWDRIKVNGSSRDEGSGY
jgi:hypothetical protein